MSDLPKRYMDAFKRVEHQLRVITCSKQHGRFNDLVNEAAKSNVVIQNIEGRLKALGNLRNSLSHERQELATPTLQTVEWIERIADSLESPPKLSSLFAIDIKTCKPSDSIKVVAQLMHDHAFSQVPVIEAGSIVGLLTAETIVRWLANKLCEGNTVTESPVALVMEFKEKDSFCKVLSSEATVFDALHAFDEAAKSRTDLDAILVTNEGTSGEVPIGILTSFDIPRLIESQLRGLL